MSKVRSILIATGIYPPAIGGPSQYAKNLADSLRSMNYAVSVRIYGIEHKLPTGIRHVFFFFKTLPSVITSDFIIALDTFSVGFPTVLAAWICKKKIVIRTGGDFLWEQYLERTRQKILFKDFYNTEKENFSMRERLLFSLTQWTLCHSTKVVFSTTWQRDIFSSAYSIPVDSTAIVENYYGPKEADEKAEGNVFVVSSRDLVFKNQDTIAKGFAKAKAKHPEISLFTKNLPYDEFVEVVKKSYAVMVISLGDISPNMILDAIRFNRPFICTQEVGIYDRIRSCGIYVDPLSPDEIASAIETLLDPKRYASEQDEVRKHNFIHTWNDIADDFLKIADLS